VNAGHDIAVLVPAAVQREIDRLKGDGNRRRAGRARAANKILRAVLRSTDEEEVLREGNPRVVLRIAPKPAERRLYQELDPQLPDDQIVAEALDYRAEHPMETVRVLSGDTGILLAAKRTGLGAVEIPDGWLLDPEPNLESKQIAELQRRLTVLERVHPVLRVEAQNTVGVRIETLDAEIQVFPQLSEEMLDRHVEEVCTIYPRRDEFKVPSPPDPLQVLAGLTYVQPPTSKEIEDYYNDYERWVSEVREFFEHLPATLTNRARRALLRLVVSNEGAAPATGLLVEFAAVGGLSFRRKDEEEMDLYLAYPPTPPEARIVSNMPDFAKMLGASDSMLKLRDNYIPDFTNLHRPPRDPNKFYWKYRQPTEWAFSCDEFRHHSDAEVFDLTLVGSQAGAINYRVTASNMPEAVKGTVPVRFIEVEGVTVTMAREIIRRSAYSTKRTGAED
jgi:hypothetical protein